MKTHTSKLTRCPHPLNDLGAHRLHESAEAIHLVVTFVLVVRAARRHLGREEPCSPGCAPSVSSYGIGEMAQYGKSETDDKGWWIDR